MKVFLGQLVNIVDQVLAFFLSKVSHERPLQVCLSQKLLLLACALSHQRTLGIRLV